MAIMDISAIRKRVYLILEPTYKGDRISYWFDVFITAVILLSISVMVLSSVSSLSARYSLLFKIVFLFTTLVFSIEYPLRLWSCTLNPSYSHPVRGRLAWALTPFAFIDLIVVFHFLPEHLYRDKPHRSGGIAGLPDIQARTLF